jgi:CheY-like chemotaxis protein
VGLASAPNYLAHFSFIGDQPRVDAFMSKEIMVIDDDLQMRRLVSLVLQRRGFAVVEAKDAYAALNLLEDMTPTLIILDLMMPGMDGFELCRKIRSDKHTRETPIIAMSASFGSQNERLSLEAGANQYLSKVSLHVYLTVTVTELLTAQFRGVR